jgi:hypothetical protein
VPYLDEDLACREAHLHRDLLYRPLRRNGRVLSARRWIIAVWVGLCLAGIAATSALDVEPHTDEPESPAEKPIPTGSYVVDCQEIADDIEQAQAEAERERQEMLNPSATPEYRGTDTLEMVAVPEECADELEERGMKKH